MKKNPFTFKVTVKLSEEQYNHIVSTSMYPAKFLRSLINSHFGLIDPDPNQYELGFKRSYRRTGIKK